MKKKLIFLTVLTMALATLLSGCRDIQIFEKVEEMEKVQLTEDQIAQNVYYVKEGTRFTKVYMPQGNATSRTTKINTGRIVYFYDDEFMMPEHYKGELIAYASAEANLSSMTLERFEDIGYSFGIYGGSVQEDGYYHFSVEDDTIEGSEARTLFSKTASDEIRIVTVGGIDVSKLVDEGSGIILKLEQDQPYIVEFYAGTYFYRASFVADTHFMRAFEVYNFDSEYISDTTHGYMCFNTPESLKSGYYNVNGTGLMVYHAHVKGEAVENEDMNEGYYANIGEVIASYSQQYSINVPQATKDMIIEVVYGNITEAIDQNIEVGGYLQAPDGTGYDMEVNESKRTMTITLAMAQAGEWTLNISPKSLEVIEINVIGDETFEDTTLYEQEFVVAEDAQYQMFYADITGDLDAKIQASVVGEDGVTYNFLIGTYKDADGFKRNYIYVKIPYLKAGTYTVKIYYYKSTTGVQNVQLLPYDANSSDIFFLEEEERLELLGE